MKLHALLFRSLPLAALCAAAGAAQAQNCTGTISADVSQVSLTTGGVQHISLSVAPAQLDHMWQMVGAYGTQHPIPMFAYGGLRLDNDRYLFRTFTGHAGFMQGVTTGVMGGPLVNFDASGHAQVQVVIPPGLPASFIGKTLHHGMYFTHQLTMLPWCGTGTVPLTIIP